MRISGFNSETLLAVLIFPNSRRLRVLQTIARDSVVRVLAEAMLTRLRLVAGGRLSLSPASVTSRWSTVTLAFTVSGFCRADAISVRVRLLPSNQRDQSRIVTHQSDRLERRQYGLAGPRRHSQTILDADQRAERLIHVKLNAASLDHAGTSSTSIEGCPSGAADR